MIKEGAKITDKIRNLAEALHKNEVKVKGLRCGSYFVGLLGDCIEYEEDIIPYVILEEILKDGYDMSEFYCSQMPVDNVMEFGNGKGVLFNAVVVMDKRHNDPWRVVWECVSSEDGIIYRTKEVDSIKEAVERSHYPI